MSTLTVKIGPNDKEVQLAARTPRAVVAAARTVLPTLDVVELRELATWTEWCREDIFYPHDASGKAEAPLSIVGAAAAWIACAVLDVLWPENIDDEADAKFIRRVLAMAPRVKSIAS